MAVEIRHIVEYANLSDFNDKLENMVNSISSSFSQYADMFSKIPDMKSFTPGSAPGASKVNTELNNEELIKSDKDLAATIGKLNTTMGKVVDNARDPGKKGGWSERDTKVLGSAVGGIVAAGLYKLGSQYESLGTTLGQQFQAVNQTPASAKQFITSQFNAQSQASTDMWKTGISTGMAGSGAGIGAVIGSAFGPIGTGIGAGIGAGVGYLGSNIAGNKLNEDLQRKQAAYGFALNVLDTSQRLNMRSGRYGAGTTSTGQAITLPEIPNAMGGTSGGGTYKMTPLQEQLIKGKSPFINNAEDILGGLRGRITPAQQNNLPALINQIGATATAAGIPEGQMGAFTTQVQMLARYSGKDMKETLDKIYEANVKYGGDTVKNLDTTIKVLQTSGMGDVNQVLDFISKQQLNPQAIQTAINFASQNPTNRYVLQTIGKQIGWDVDYISKHGLSPAQVKQMGDWQNPNAIPNIPAQVAGMIADRMGTTVPQLVKGFKGLEAGVGPTQNITDQALKNVTPPSTQEFMGLLENALSNLRVTDMNVSAVNLYMDQGKNRALEVAKYIGYSGNAPSKNAGTGVKTDGSRRLSAAEVSQTVSQIPRVIHKVRD